MTINNVQELLNHMETDLNVKFQDYIWPDTETHFNIMENGMPAVSDTDKWIRITGERFVEIGGYYMGNTDYWFSDQFVFPFDSEDFDSYVAALDASQF